MHMQKLKTACGGFVVIPPKAMDHLVAHPDVHNVLPEAVSRVILPRDGTFLTAEIEMGRVVGRSGCVKAPPINIGDRALFAQRIGRNFPSRVILREGEETTKIAVLAFASRENMGTYVLVTSWVGPCATKEPWDQSINSTKEFQHCLQFWRHNALAWKPTIMSEPFESSWEDILRKVS